MLLILKLKLSYLCLFVSALEISENTFFTEHLWAAASVPTILLFLLILNGFFDKARLKNEERHLKFFKLFYFFPKNCTKALWKIFLEKIRKVEGGALSFSQTSKSLVFCSHKCCMRVLKLVLPQKNIKRTYFSRGLYLDKIS